jgi:hypothetical protein
VITAARTPAPDAPATPATATATPHSTIRNRANPQPTRHEPPTALKTTKPASLGGFGLSPQARQLVVHTGHAVEEADPDLVTDAILDVVKASR